ncbi:MAG: biopolymer transporter ExbD, partial [Comamonadaceae bacterium]
MGIRYASQQEGEDRLIAEINTTPLVDVMLVLLIIFLITIPVVNSSIAVTLPREQNLKQDATQENV